DDRAALPLISSLPRTYYTTADACGPDGQVCCQFDFGPSARSDCFHRFEPSNVSTPAFAKKLVNQYRKLQEYYRSSSLLVPIGDDFFFSNPADWTENYENYKVLMDFINSHKDFNMKVRLKAGSKE
uniref:Glyco_hydro_38N domain-containing protein n=1 Tax=Bursaphelenchus xylophilus TaxID=6326 RepID=A0A1I7SKF8_BURXY